jgi:flap endonuclease-1
MGIKGLSKLIQDHAPSAIIQSEMKHFFGRKIAIDASMSIYQFLVAVRSEGNVLMDESGETTSHLMGIFYRTLRMIDNGLKPIYVFDGKPPVMKSGELAKRNERRQEAQQALEKAQEDGDTEKMDKFNRRVVKATKEHSEECKKLLRLMGIPVIDAPCEAEAQCAYLATLPSIYGAGSEDMDTLTFGAKKLLRHLTFSEARKMPIMEISLDKVLEGLNFTMEQFVDLCILLGCDYCDSIRGIGPKKVKTLLTGRLST